MAGAFHAFSAYGVHRLASSFDLDARTDGLLISVMVIGFAQGSWAWGKLGDESAVRNKIARGAPLVALGFWCLLVVAPPSNPLALGLVLLAVGFMTSSFSVIYLMLTELAAPDARSAVKAAANCGIALGACVAQLAISHLPDALSAAPSAALGVVGVLCCLALANRCHSEATAATLDETESEADAPGAAPADA
jgi:predicted MFS family arabinose efflux permease